MADFLSEEQILKQLIKDLTSAEKSFLRGISNPRMAGLMLFGTLGKQIISEYTVDKNTAFDIITKLWREFNV